MLMKLRSVSFISLVLLLLLSSALHANQERQVAADAFKFPITPGMPEWRQLNSHAEMVAKSQVPEHKLRAMSTDGLINTVLSYPLLGDMLAFNSIQEGFDTVARNFNGLHALLERPDAGESLL